MAGAVCVALTGWFTYLAGKRIRSTEFGLVAATLLIAALSSVYSGYGATLSEHVALVPLMGGLAILLLKPITPQRLFWVGVALSAASMIRLNLAYTALGVGLVAILFLDHEERSAGPLSKSILLRGVSYAAGALLVIFLTSLPYIITNQAFVWWESVVLAPISYSESTFTPLEALDKYREMIVTLMFDRESGTLHSQLSATLLFAGALIGFVMPFVWLAAQRFAYQTLRWWVILLTFFLTITFSILNSGQVFEHYLLQIMPFLALFAAFLFEPLLFTQGRPRVAFYAGLIAILLMLPLTEYRFLYTRVSAGLPLKHGRAYSVAGYLEGLDVEDQSLYLMRDHIVYWLLDKYPLTASSTHPSNISKEYLLRFSSGPGVTSEMALLEILEQEPDFIVKKQQVGYLHDKHNTKVRLNETIANDYRFLQEIEGLEVYQRVK